MKNVLAFFKLTAMGGLLVLLPILLFILLLTEIVNLMVLCPHAPSGFAGPLKIVPADCITPLDASLGEVSLVFNHLGLGAGRLLKTKGPETLSTGEKPM